MIIILGRTHFVSMLAQNRNCKLQINVIDVLPSRPLIIAKLIIGLQTHREKAKVEARPSYRVSITIGVNEFIKHGISNIAHASITRGARG